MPTLPEEIVVSTGDIRGDYEIIGPVYLHLSNRGILGSQFSRLQAEYKKALQDWARSGQSTGTRPGVSDVYLAFLGEWSPGYSSFDKAFFIAIEELRKRSARPGPMPSSSQDRTLTWTLGGSSTSTCRCTGQLYGSSRRD